MNRITQLLLCSQSGKNRFIQVLDEQGKKTLFSLIAYLVILESQHGAVVLFFRIFTFFLHDYYPIFKELCWSHFKKKFFVYCFKRNALLK